MFGKVENLNIFEKEKDLKKEELINIIEKGDFTDKYEIQKKFFRYKGEISFDEFDKIIKHNKTFLFKDSILESYLTKEFTIYLELIKLLPKTAENIKKLLEYFEVYEDEKIEFLRKILFECETYGSEIFEEILRKTLENNTDIYTEMRNIIKEFIEKNIDKEENKGINKDLLNSLYKGKNPTNLLLYIRYGHRIDNPEIAEMLGIFLDEMIKRKKFRFFDKLKIITRYGNKYYPRFFLKNLSIKDENVFFTENEDFEKKLLENVVIFTSHSSHPKVKEGKNNIPYIISGAMFKENLSYKVDIELEESKAKSNKNIRSLSVEEILR